MSESSQVLATSDVRSFFQESVVSALEQQGLQAREDTIVYLINLLADFARADRLYEWTPDGYALRPLALLYGDAVQASTNELRNQALRRLGDVALFVAGLFADSLQRQAVDVDYYIAMGGNAYGYLSDRHSSRAHRPVFEELSQQFTDFVDVLSLISGSCSTDHQDVLRLYENWLRTGNRHSARKLRQLGVHVVSGPGDSRQH